MKNRGIDKIVRYCMNPKKYPKQGKEEIEKTIDFLNQTLLDPGSVEQDGTGLLGRFCEEYTSDDIRHPINMTIYKTRADDQGISSTRLYKEIYFNEIIQNANDNTQGDTIFIMASKDGDEYTLSFRYKDKGFSVENIVGFFNTEIHTKREDLASTGKHGVGIKALFYFVDSMKIKSNVCIEFVIREIQEDGIDKIESVSSRLYKNEHWDTKDTVFEIKFRKNKTSGDFHVEKLENFIDKILDGKTGYEDVGEFFFGTDQRKLIFDIRGLLFTDKNRGRETGIKKMDFQDGEGRRMLTLSCREEPATGAGCGGQNRVYKASLNFNEEVKETYLLFTRDNGEGQQNFSAAFPFLDCRMGERRYYETYYLPDEHDGGLNLLINSGYSNVSRTKLTDGDNDRNRIRGEIESGLKGIYSMMADETWGQSSLGTDISRLFHKLLKEDIALRCKFCDYKINNRYLNKQRTDQISDRDRYLIYERQEKECYEKQMLAEKFNKTDKEGFFREQIVAAEGIKYDKGNFLPEVSEIYDIALQPGEYKLRSVLNLAGNVRDLLYYRISGSFPKEADDRLSDRQVDAWHEKLFAKGGKELVELSFSFIGRYKLHSNVKSSGEITGASFLQYLFTDHEASDGERETLYPTFRNKQRELYDKKYEGLKAKLWRLAVNPRVDSCKGELFNRVYESEEYRKKNCNPKECSNQVCFYGSYHFSANTFYYGEMVGEERDNTEIFGKEEAELLVRKICEDKLWNALIWLDGKLMIIDDFWGNVRNSGRELWHSSEYYYKRGMEPYKEQLLYKFRLINISFLQHIYVDSFDKYMFYATAFLDSVNRISYQKYKGWDNCLRLGSLDSQGCWSSAIMDKNELMEVFRFYYEQIRSGQLKIGSSDGWYYGFAVTLKGNLSHNECPEDFREFVKAHVKKEVWVIQTNAVKPGREEILYVCENKLYLLDKGKRAEIGQCFNNRDEILVVHNGRSNFKGAICKVLEQCEEEKDVVEKCKAFIPSDKEYTMAGEDYNQLTGRSKDINKRFRKIGEGFDADKGGGEKFTCENIKKIITARGNNNGTCCCCGNKLADYSRLIITENENERTKADYPQIYEVVCGGCWKILTEGLKKTELEKRPDGQSYEVVYECVVGNTHQIKPIKFRTKIYDGILKLCRR